jgi:hypothetical protein
MRRWRWLALVLTTIAVPSLLLGDPIDYNCFSHTSDEEAGIGEIEKNTDMSGHVWYIVNSPRGTVGLTCYSNTDAPYCTACVYFRLYKKDSLGIYREHEGAYYRWRTAIGRPCPEPQMPPWNSGQLTAWYYNATTDVPAYTPLGAGDYKMEIMVTSPFFASGPCAENSDELTWNPDDIFEWTLPAE